MRSIFEDGSWQDESESWPQSIRIWAWISTTPARGQCRVTMIGYVDEILEAWKKVDQSTLTRMVSRLWPVNKRKTKSTCCSRESFCCQRRLQEVGFCESNGISHTYRRQSSLHVTKRARPDISVAIAFLTMRVRQPDQDDWSKLGASHEISYMVLANYH